MAEETAKKKPAAGKAAGGSPNVRAKILQGIVFGGIAVRPKVDNTKRPGKAVITPVEAIVPRSVAEAAGPEMVQILADAPDDAKLGAVEQSTG